MPFALHVGCSAFVNWASKSLSRIITFHQEAQDGQQTAHLRWLGAKTRHLVRLWSTWPADPTSCKRTPAETSIRGLSRLDSELCAESEAMVSGYEQDSKRHKGSRGHRCIGDMKERGWHLAMHNPCLVPECLASHRGLLDASKDGVRQCSGGGAATFF